MYSRLRRLKPHVPLVTSGHLYYVKLKTGVGTFYKIGFTTLPSVKDRLGYGGSGDEKYIDKVLFFSYFEDAFFIEQKLHQYFMSSNAFGQFSSKEFIPFFKNGQSELYMNDVLRMDPSFTADQENEAKDEVRKAYARKAGRTVYSAKTASTIDSLITILVKILGSALFVIFIPLFYLIKLFNSEEYKKNNVRAARDWEIRRGKELINAREMENLIEGLHQRKHEVASGQD